MLESSKRRLHRQLEEFGLRVGKIWCAGETVSLPVIGTMVRKADNFQRAAAVMDGHVATFTMIFTIGE